MTQSECAIEHLLQAIKREVCKPDSYLPQSIRGFLCLKYFVKESRK